MKGLIGVFTMICTVMLLVFLPYTLMAQAPADAPISLILMANGFIEDNLEGRTWGAGIETGFQATIDGGRGLSMRATYKRANFGPAEDDAIGSITNSAILDWMISGSMDFFLNFGGQSYVDGEFSGTDLYGGAGLGFGLWKSASAEYEVPPQLRGFVEVIFSDANSQPTDNFFQINVGILVPKPKKHPEQTGKLERHYPNPVYFTAISILPESHLKDRARYLDYILGNTETFLVLKT